MAEPGIKTLSTGLALSSTLLRLDLSGNLLNAEAAQVLGRALRSSPLDAAAAAAAVAGNGSNAGAGESGASASAEEEVSAGGGGGAGPPPLEFLDVSKNPLGDEGGAALFLALAASPTLTGLVMAEAGLGASAAAALAAALAAPRPPPAVAGADLNSSGTRTAPATPASTGKAGSSPPLVAPAASPAARQGRGLPLLKTLDVSKNEFGAGGAAELAAALSAGGAPQLESLSVGYNRVGDGGAAALGRAAGPRLAVLDLSGNALSGEGLGAVLSAPGLREAKLFHNACGDEGEQKKKLGTDT